MGRPQLIPLTEENKDMAVIGELILNPWNGKVSVRNPLGQIVSMDANIQTKLQTIENSLKSLPNSTSLNAVNIKEEFLLVDNNTELDAEDLKQIFTIEQGTYELGLNRIEAYVGTMRFSASKGNLIELSETKFKLIENLPAGSIVEVKYYEVLKAPEMSYGMDVIIQNNKPDVTKIKPGTLWIYADTPIK